MDRNCCHIEHICSAPPQSELLKMVCRITRNRELDPKKKMAPLLLLDIIHYSICTRVCKASQFVALFKMNFS